MAEDHGDDILMHKKWITAAELDRWAATSAARSALPELIRRLVHATCRPGDLERVNFPGGEEVHRPGYDGETKVQGGNAWVPEGLAYWELSTSEGVKDKLEKDYSHRLATRGAGDFSVASYIAVSARDFQNGGKWAEEKRARNDWRDVRVYDSNALEQWLETSPAVGLWLAKLMGRRVQGVSDLLGHWENLQGALRRLLPPTVPLISRGETIKRFEEWQAGTPGPLEIRAESPQEVMDVFCAWALSLPAEKQPPIFSRALIVDEVESWRELAVSRQPLILVAGGSLEVAPELVAEAVRNGHHVLVPAPVGRPSGHRLARINRSALKDALVAANLKDAEAHSLAQHCGGSFTILKRQFHRPLLAATPKWGEAAAATELAPLLLVGAWQDGMAGDQGVVARITEQPYDKALAVLNHWRAERDSPIRWSNGTWEFVSPVDAWPFLAPKLTRKQLDAFEEGVVEVLGRDNPMYELAISERWCAQIHGKVLQHSGTLRETMARTLALMATRSDSAPVTDTLPLQGRVNRVVRRIFPPKAPWQRWASLGSLLTTLAEAAPDALLDVMEADLREPAPALARLFAEEGADNMTGRAEHVGVLWALERMAWSPDYLPRAALILARLAELDPGGRIGNRPHASLRETFCTWLPHTMATADQRREVLETINKKWPSVGWNLVLGLFPESHSAIVSRQTPEWRFWAEDWAPGGSRAEHDKGVKAAIALACGIAEKSPEKWPEIIERLGSIPKEEFLAVVAAVGRLAVDETESQLRAKLWEAVQGLVQRHRAFAKAEWALPDEALVQLEVLRDRLRPTDPAALAVPMFARRFDMTGDDGMNWDQRMKALREQRKQAIAAVIGVHGLDGVLALAGRVEEARLVGLTLADAVGVENDSRVLPGLLVCGNKSLEAVASGYTAARAQGGGIIWAKTLPLAGWKPAETGLLLSHLSFTTESWDFAKTFGDAVELTYWEHAPYYFSHGLAADAVETAARKLIAIGRPIAALQMLESHANDTGCPPSETLAELTTLALTAPKHENYQLDSHVIETIVARLQRDTDLDQGRLASLEWLALPALRWTSGQPRTLLREISRRPGLFVDLLSILYRANRDKAMDSPPDEERQLQANRVQQLLHNWKIVPGTKDDGKVDSKDLQKWVREAREKATACDRIAACDIVIGEALAHAPAEEDGVWPCLAIRDLLDEVNSADMEHGLEIGLANKRGATWRGEGGDQERQLAQKYGDYSRACATRWPRTATVLKCVADSYLAEAKRGDAEAEATE